MHFSSSTREESLHLLSPMTVNLEGYFYNLRQRFSFQVDIQITSTKRPLRLMGKAAEEVSLAVRGRDRKAYMQQLQLEIEDYMEASGYLG